MFALALPGDPLLVIAALLALWLLVAMAVALALGRMLSATRSEVEPDVFDDRREVEESLAALRTPRGEGSSASVARGARGTG